MARILQQRVNLFGTVWRDDQGVVQMTITCEGKYADADSAIPVDHGLKDTRVALVKGTDFALTDTMASILTLARTRLKADSGSGD
jgi:hypothetical protein